METNRFKEGLAGLIAKEIKTQSAKFILNRSKKMLHVCIFGCNPKIYKGI
jgi:hypothetical protein